MGKPKVYKEANMKTSRKKKAKASLKERTAPITKATRKTNTNSKTKTMKVEDLIMCRVEGLETLNDLARKYRGKLNLQLKCVRKEQTALNIILNHKLIRWETELNRICYLDPVIAVENFVDNEGPPGDFHYVRENITNEFGKALLDPSFLVGCECSPRCSHTNCTCPSNSHGKFAYDRKKRVLLPPGSPIYECNPNCKCTMDCPNRVIQKGLTSRVCIFRTDDGRGWGLKTREFIPKNKFVVEYVGEIITSEEAERRGKMYDSKQQTYLFDLDFHDEDATFTVDAYHYGNVSHFINHSCDPNLQVYSVWVETLDPRLPRIGLFARRDIQAGEELSFDYMMTYTHDSSEDAANTSVLRKSNKKKSIDNCKSKKDIGQQSNIDGNIERVFCACGANNCRKYLF